MSHRTSRSDAPRFGACTPVKGALSNFLGGPPLRRNFFSIFYASGRQPANKPSVRNSPYMTSRTLSFLFLAAVLATAETAPTVQRGLTVTVLQGDVVVHALPNPGSSHSCIRVADTHSPIRPRAYPHILRRREEYRQHNERTAKHAEPRTHRCARALETRNSRCAARGRRRARETRQPPGDKPGPQSRAGRSGLGSTCGCGVRRELSGSSGCWVATSRSSYTSSRTSSSSLPCRRSHGRNFSVAGPGGAMTTRLRIDENSNFNGLERPIDVRAAARFLGVSPSLVYAYVERKQIPHFRMMGRTIRFRLSELDSWRQQFHVNGGING